MMMRQRLWQQRKPLIGFNSLSLAFRGLFQSSGERQQTEEFSTANFPPPTLMVSAFFSSCLVDFSKGYPRIKKISCASMCVISKACWLRIIKRNNFRNSFPAPPSPLRLRSLNQQHEIISVQIISSERKQKARHCGIDGQAAFLRVSIEAQIYDNLKETLTPATLLVNQLSERHVVSAYLWNPTRRVNFPFEIVHLAQGNSAKSLRINVGGTHISLSQNFFHKLWKLLRYLHLMMVR